MERGIGQRVPARGLPAQIERQRLGGLPVREALQRLQHQHRADHRRRNRRAGPAADGNRSSIIESGNRRPRCRGQKSEDAARGQQLPGQRLHIQIPALSILTTLHETSLKSPAPRIQQARQQPADYSAPKMGAGTARMAVSAIWTAVRRCRNGRDH